MTSPVKLARLVGVFYLLTILAGIFAQGFVSGRLVAGGDAAATAAGILGHERLYRTGLAVYLVEMACQVTMTVLFYQLLKPVGRTTALVAMVLGLIGCGIKTMSRLFYAAPLLVLGPAAYLGVFDRAQREAMAQLFLGINDRGAAIALFFFGLNAVLVGWLVIRSGFLPRFLGVLSVLGGLGWLTYLWPPLGDRLFPVIVSVALPASLVMIGWLLVAGVNDARWLERAETAAAEPRSERGTGR